MNFMLSAVSVGRLLDRVNRYDRWIVIPFVSLSMPSQLGEVDRVFVGLRHLRGRVVQGATRQQHARYSPLACREGG